MSSQPTFDFCAGLVAALASQGVHHAAVSPGSRNTPLLLALAANDAIEISVHHDERSGGFFALGLAKATGRPTVLCCTSGTAATEYLPALTEATMSHTPLIVLTADRPPELQNRGAPQTIDQTNLYGNAAKWFHDPGVPDGDSVADVVHLGRQAVATSVESPAGPVHLNIPLRAPLVPHAPLGQAEPQQIEHFSATVPRPALDEEEITRLSHQISGKRILIVAGATSAADAGNATGDLATALGAIVVADPQSELRFAGDGHRSLISMADLMISAGADALPPPELVVHVGAIHTSKAINTWINGLEADLIHIHDGRWQDPLGIATEVLVADPAAAARELSKVVAATSASFLETWRQADDAAADAVATQLVTVSEPAIAHTLLTAVPPASTIVSGSSMPIRLIDSYGLPGDTPRRVIANRGANGIDGTIATALGVAAASGRPTYALIGDLAVLADVGSLATARRLNLPVTLVVINNDGGGIFDFLPQADGGRVERTVYEDLIRTRHGLELSPIAASFGLEVAAAGSLDELAALVAEPAEGPRLIEVMVPSDAGPADRKAAVAAVATAIRSA